MPGVILKKLIRDGWPILPLLILLAVLTFGMTKFLPLLSLERVLQDLRIARLSEEQPPHEDIIVIAIDEGTLASLPYRSPVPRNFLNALVGILIERKVRAIGIDILIDQKTEEVHDLALRATLEAAPVPVFGVTVRNRAWLTPAQQSYHDAFFAEIARGHGELIQDPVDGVTRRFRILTDNALPGLAEALARTQGISPAAGEYIIDWRCCGQAFRVFPAHAAALLPAAWLEDKIVLIGPVQAVSDRHATPLRFSLTAPEEIGMPGVLVHAQILAQLLDGRSQSRLSEGADAVLLGLAVGLGVIFGVLPLSVWARLVLVMTAIIAAAVLAFGAYAQWALLVPIVVPSMAFLLSTFATMAWIGSRHRQERMLIRGAFDQYMAPEVINRLLADPSLLKLGGERREIVSLFTDLEGFTSLSETMSSVELGELLNPYFDGMMDVVMEQQGTIDKIIGDALHVLFNAPEDQEDYADRALKCALGMSAFGRKFQEEVAARGIKFGRTRIGLNGGFASVGNFGGHRRMDYTAHGDVVNTAARLEGANKALGTEICVSGFVIEHSDGSLLTRPIGNILLRGKSEPLPCFEPLLEDKAAFALEYGRAYALLDHDPEAALAAFAALHERYPDDPLIKRHSQGDGRSRIDLS